MYLQNSWKISGLMTRSKDFYQIFLEEETILMNIKMPFNFKGVSINTFPTWMKVLKQTYMGGVIYF